MKLNYKNAFQVFSTDSVLVQNFQLTPETGNVWGTWAPLINTHKVELCELKPVFKSHQIKMNRNCFILADWWLYCTTILKLELKHLGIWSHGFNRIFAIQLLSGPFETFFFEDFSSYQLTLNGNKQLTISNMIGFKRKLTLHHTKKMRKTIR